MALHAERTGHTTPARNAKRETALKHALDERLRAVEDRLAIYPVVSAHGCAIDGCNTDVAGDLYAEDSVYAVGDFGTFEGREAITGIAATHGHLALMAAGCGHVATLPHVMLYGDRAVVTGQTMVVKSDGANGYVVARLSESRIVLSRQADGQWRIDHRQNHLQNAGGKGAALLARLKEPPACADDAIPSSPA